MSTLRRHVRLWTVAWFLIQAASLSALVPRDCCAAHRAPVDTPSCHEAPKVEHCPMRGAGGTPCPMHKAATSHDHDDAATTPRCVIRGTCGGQSVFAVLSTPGIPAAPMTVAARTPASHDHPSEDESAVSRVSVPDPGPPRA